MPSSSRTRNTASAGGPPFRQRTLAAFKPLNRHRVPGRATSDLPLDEIAFKDKAVDPIRPLLWVSKSVAKLAAALRDLGHRVSANTVRRLLRTLGFSRQGNFKNPGTDWRAKGRPRRVNGHDFADKTLGKAIPSGVYDVTHDTAQFAVNAIRLWLEKMGRGCGCGSANSRHWPMKPA